MFVGHYGPSFVVKAMRQTIPLWLLFVAVQVVDVVWAVLVLLRVERVRIVPGITASNPLALDYMPYTHSLIAVLVWSVGIIFLVKLVARTGKWGSAGLIGAAVFSHWIFDWLVHRPDLPLYDNAMKVGLGLWNYPVIALGLEALFLFGGILVYMRRTRALDPMGRFGPPIFGLLMLLIQIYLFFGPPPSSTNHVATTALVLYLAFATGAYWLDRKRLSKTLTAGQTSVTQNWR